ncbi:hypothetical protein TNCV_2386811 [Trichonephila clavipes]|nr:hypothetical protein TNCV_2386811 [Trichonephila clavipes]
MLFSFVDVEGWPLRPSFSPLCFPSLSMQHQQPTIGRDMTSSPYMDLFEKVSVLLDCLTISSAELAAVNDDDVCITPSVANKVILEFVKSSKNIIDSDSDDENEMNNAAPVPSTSEMRNIAVKEYDV